MENNIYTVMGSIIQHYNNQSWTNTKYYLTIDCIKIQVNKQLYMSYIKKSEQNKTMYIKLIQIDENDLHKGYVPQDIL